MTKPMGFHGNFSVGDTIAIINYLDTGYAYKF